MRFMSWTRLYYYFWWAMIPVALLEMLGAAVSRMYGYFVLDTIALGFIVWRLDDLKKKLGHN